MPSAKKLLLRYGIGFGAAVAGVVIGQIFGLSLEWGSHAEAFDETREAAW